MDGFTRRKKVSLQFDMAPLIDVVFLLLIFFMLTNTMIAQEAINIQLPLAESAQQQNELPLIVSLNKDGQVLFQGKTVSLADLANLLAAELKSAAEKPILLQTDADVNVQSMINVMDKISAAGGKNVSIATRSDSN